MDAIGAAHQQPQNSRILMINKANSAYQMQNDTLNDSLCGCRTMIKAALKIPALCE